MSDEDKTTNSGRFTSAPDPRRSNAGRKKGGKNRMHSRMQETVLKKADAFTPEAFEMMKSIIRGDVKGASVSNIITCIVKTFELGDKYRESLESIVDRAQEEVKKERAQEEGVQTPLISLTSEPTSSGAKH